jgi:hypothetical protein
MLLLKKRAVGLGLICATLLPAADASASGWWQGTQALQQIFDPSALTTQMAPSLSYFAHAFMAVGAAIVIISSVRRVARARTGDESMGWVAGMVFTVALMAGGPRIGGQIFQAADALAASSGYKNSQAIFTAWEALRVVMPGQSPVSSVMATTNQTVDPSNTTKQDAAWTKRAWEWMKRAWGAMQNAAGSFVAGLRDALNDAVIFAILVVPAAALLLGTVVLSFGTYLREILHHVMDVFLPLMIAMLSLGATRAPAGAFVLKYIGVALWPVAWALGNAVALSLLVSTMDWVVQSCRDVLGPAVFASAATLNPVLKVGILPAAAPLMSWGLLTISALSILFCAVLLLVSAFAAPIALTKALTKGACFAEEQVRQAFAAMSTVTASPGNVSGSGGSSLFGAWAGRAAQSMQGVGSGAAAVSRAAGPVGWVASMAASLAARTAKRSSVAAASNVSDAAVSRSAPSAASILETLRSNSPSSSRMLAKRSQR